ncbi:MAG: ANTAR domain-containing response regulator [Solirubrobacteraceae bacterium]
MTAIDHQHLRVLIADEKKERLAPIATIVAELGHTVIAQEIEVKDVGAVTAREQPDVALVRLGDSTEHALELIDRIVNEAACPVIALTDAKDESFVGEASKRGVFAYIDDTDLGNYQSSIDVALRRFAEYHILDGAFKRRAAIEQAKGILMERHGIDEDAAFVMLRHQSHTSNRRIIDLASAVIDGHLLLRTTPQDPTQP